MIFVVSDDLTGAAEMSGIGRSYGLSTTLLTEIPDTLPDTQLVVLATDTRAMTETEAVAETHRICRNLHDLLSTARDRIVFFKKVDNYVRGHVVGELTATLEETVYQQALYMPANPSRGTIIRGGCFYLDGEPIDQTRFAFDADFPATMASICLRLKIVPDHHIRVPEAVVREDVRQVVRSAIESPNLTLLAGGADLFSALLEYRGHERVSEYTPFHGLDNTGTSIIVCGSPVSTDISSQPFVRRQDLPLDSMPREVYEGRQGATYWLANMHVRHFTRSAIKPARHGLVLNIPHERSSNHQEALRLRTEMASVVEKLTERLQPSEMIIEGGATALAILNRLGWSSFRITDHISFGIVRMQCLQMPSVHLTFKPGSCKWGEVLFG